MISYRELSKFWGMLTLSWLFMTTEFTLVNAFIARLAEPKYNLAAFGVTLSLMMLCESPVFPAISAANALVKDKVSLQQLGKFTNILSATMSAVLLLFTLTPAFTVLVHHVMQIDPVVADLVRPGLIFLVLTPLVVGYRRFNQGLLLSFGRANIVAYGTAVRLSTVTVTGLLLMRTELPGAHVAAISFMCGMIADAIVSRLAATRCIREFKKIEGKTNLTYRSISAFYTPLAVTSMILISIQPITSFFLSRGAFALESLAVFPVISGLVLIFKSTGIAFQEVTISVLTKDPLNVRALERFGFILAAGVTVILLSMSFTPLAHLWFEHIGGLPPELIHFTRVPFLVMSLMPAVTIWSAFQRGLFICNGVTRSVSTAGVLEVISVFVIMLCLTTLAGFVGADAAALSLFSGSIIANLYLRYVRGTLNTLSTTDRSVS